MDMTTKLRKALVGLVGSDNKQELQSLLIFMQALPANEKANDMIYAIRVLIDTQPVHPLEEMHNLLDKKLNTVPKAQEDTFGCMLIAQLEESKFGS